MKSHIFEVNGGEEVINGKPHWQNSLYIEMSPSEAWDLLEQLTSQLRRKHDDNEKIIGLNFVGLLKGDDEC